MDFQYEHMGKLSCNVPVTLAPWLYTRKGARAYSIMAPSQVLRRERSGSLSSDCSGTSYST
jgi:hypothetical protein